MEKNPEHNPDQEIILRDFLAPKRLYGIIKAQREEHKEAKRERLVLRPINDRGGAVGVYSGPSGPIATIVRMMNNVSRGRPPGEGLSPNALNDRNSP
jgi:hypothetical protein